MTRKSMLNILIISLFLASMIIIIGVMQSTKSENSVSLSSEPYSSSIQFVLKEYDGKLALFRGQSQTPYQTLDFDVSYLSEYDRELLRHGIGVDTQTELEALIEDYTS